MQPKRPQRWFAFLQYALVVSVSAIVTLWQLGLPSIDGHEAYVAVTAKTMAEPDHWLDNDTADGPLPANTALNHWLIPVFNGHPRLVKSPLAYWTLGVMLKAGLPLNDFTSRVPSALAAIVLAVLTLALGRRMFSARAALIASLMLATSLGVFSWGRNARADMQMVLWMTVSMACFYMAISTTRARNIWFLTGWSAIGVACLAKQFVPVFVVLPILAYLCWKASEHAWPQQDRPRRLLVSYMIASAAGLAASVLITRIPALHWWRVLGLSGTLGGSITLGATLGLPLIWYAIQCRSWTESRHFLQTILPGAAIMCLLFVPWMLYMGHIFPQAEGIFSHQTIQRAVGSGGWLDRSAAPLTGYYVRSLAKWTLPWVAFLPGALAIPFMHRFSKDRPVLVFLLLWVFGLVLLFSAAVGKHEQYILPALPPACLLMGFCANDVFFEHRWISPRLSRVIIVSYAILLTVAVLGAIIAAKLAPTDWRARLSHIMVLAVVLSVILWLAVWAMMRNRSSLALAALIAAATTGFVGFACCADLWDNGRSQAVFAFQAGNVVPNEAPVAGWEPIDGKIIYYFGRDIPTAKMRRDRWIRLHGLEEGTRMWDRWLRSSNPSPWIFVQAQDQQALSGYGFAQVLCEPIKCTTGRLTLMRRMPVSSDLGITMPTEKDYEESQ